MEISSPEIEAPHTFISTTDLFSLLVERKQRSIGETGFLNFPLPSALARLAQAMSDDQELDAPADTLDDFPNAVDVLAGEHLIVRNNNRVAFFHESLFDYAFARSFVRERRSLLEFLRGDEQFLFRRTQVRQILTAYRQNHGIMRYLQELKEVLTSPDVRYHLKDGVVRWLSMVEHPVDGELDIILSLDQSDAPIPDLVRLGLRRFLPQLAKC